ncbi:unnamed protein product [Symbiodinium sp. CCMP2592]|nr:unnamed protein product [Symbiodinium sp. CCMP2592]
MEVVSVQSTGMLPYQTPTAEAISPTTVVPQRASAGISGAGGHSTSRAGRVVGVAALMASWRIASRRGKVARKADEQPSYHDNRCLPDGTPLESAGNMSIRPERPPKEPFVAQPQSYEHVLDGCLPDGTPISKSRSYSAHSQALAEAVQDCLPDGTPLGQVGNRFIKPQAPPPTTLPRASRFIKPEQAPGNQSIKPQMQPTAPPRVSRFIKSEDLPKPTPSRASTGPRLPAPMDPLQAAREGPAVPDIQSAMSYRNFVRVSLDGTPGDTPRKDADQKKNRTAEKNADAAAVPALSDDPTKKEMEAAIAALNAMMELPSATPAAPEHNPPLVAAALVSEFEDTSVAVAEAVVESEDTSLLDEEVVVSEFDDASLPCAVEPVVSESQHAALAPPSTKSAVVDEVVTAMREMREEGDAKVEKENDVPSEPAWEVPERLAAAATFAASLVFVNAAFFSDVGTQIRSSPTPVAAVRPSATLPSNQGLTGATLPSAQLEGSLS